MMIPVSAEKNTPFVQALAVQSCSRNCSPAPDLVFFKLSFPRVLFSGGVFLFTDTGNNDDNTNNGKHARWSHACWVPQDTETVSLRHWIVIR